MEIDIRTWDRPTRAEAEHEARLDALAPRRTPDATLPEGAWGSPLTLECPL